MKTKACIQILVPVLLVLCLAGCENMGWYCIRGNGILEEETRELADYDGVVAEGDFEVLYIPDTVFFIVVETDQNLIPYIEDQVLE